MRKTVYVVGAGASTSFGFPTGPTLRENILRLLTYDFPEAGAEELDDDHPVALALAMTGPGLTRDVNAAAQFLRRNLVSADSIDQALHRLRADPVAVRIGKIAIAHLIRAHERDSVLGRFTGSLDNDQPLLGELRNTWIDHIFRSLVGFRSPDELLDLFDDVSFVTFNYDRCIERYFHQALRTLNPEAGFAEAVMTKLVVRHVYGSPGDYRSSTVGFGAAEGSLIEACGSLRTYTEEIAEPTTLGLIRSQVAEADNVVFLGFAFQAQNLEVLVEPGASMARPTGVFGTTMGLNPPAVDRAQRFALNSLGDSATLWTSCRCDDFLSSQGWQWLP